MPASPLGYRFSVGQPCGPRLVVDGTGRVLVECVVLVIAGSYDCKSDPTQFPPSLHLSNIAGLPIKWWGD